MIPCNDACIATHSNFLWERNPKTRDVPPISSSFEKIGWIQDLCLLLETSWFQFVMCGLMKWKILIIVVVNRRIVAEDCLFTECLDILHLALFRCSLHNYLTQGEHLNHNWTIYLETLVLHLLVAFHPASHNQHNSNFDIHWYKYLWDDLHHPKQSKLPRQYEDQVGNQKLTYQNNGSESIWFFSNTFDTENVKIGP